MCAMRFPMRVDPPWQPFLWLVGVLPGNAYVELAGDMVRVSFGLFRYRFPRANVVAARPVGRASLFKLGIGIHGNLVSGMAINGSLDGLVELRLQPPRRFWVLVIPMRVSRLFLSLKDPDAFVQALGATVGPAAR
jgi:hypothetical protein